MNRKLAAIAAAMFAVCACLALSGCGGAAETKKEYTVRVMAVLPQGAICLSPNPVDAAPGSDVSFKVYLPGDAKYAGNDTGALWEDGVLTLKNVRYPATVRVGILSGEDGVDLNAVYTVTLRYPDGVSVPSDTVSVTYGDKASFALSFEDRVEYAGNDAGAKFSRGTLTLENIASDTVINLTVNDLRSPYVSVTAGEGGTASGLEDREYRYGEAVRVLAAAREGYRFSGWSEGGFLSDGGVLVSKLESMNFDLTGNAGLFANFKKPDIHTLTLVCEEGVSAVKRTAQVAAGESVSFPVFFEAGYVFDSCDGGVYINGEIIAVNINADAAITVRAKKAGDARLYKVTLYCGAGISAKSGVAEAAEGTDAGFLITVSPGFVFSVLEGGGTYKDGVITVKNVSSDMTVAAYARAAELYRINPRANAGGAAYGGGQSFPGACAVVHAAPREGYAFIGWSTGGFLTASGALVSTEQTYTFTVPASHVYLYANFENTRDNAVILYHLNGGKVRDGGGEIYYDTFSLEGYYYPNLLPDTGILIRDGYTLLEYNTKEDGSGLAVNPGGKLLFHDPENGTAQVWCVWEKWTEQGDFEWKKDKSGIYITKYKGNADRVCVPEKINGGEVAAICAGAFAEKAFTTLILPKTLKTIEDGAFLRCPNFETLYLFDNLTSATDKAFTDCRRFSNFRFNACMPPRYVNSQTWSHFRRFERLAYLSCRKEPILMFLSGSSTQYTVDSPLIERILSENGYRYNVLNYGTNMSTCALFYMEVAHRFMREGDVIVACPEYGGNQLGDAVINSTLLQGNEGAYNIYRYVDMASYTGIINAVVTFNNTRLKNPAGIRYDSYYTGFDRYADISFERPNKPDNYILASQPLSPDAAVFTVERVSRINLMYLKLGEAGIRLYYSFASMNANAVTVSEEDLEKYESAMREKLNAPVISDIHSAIMEGKYFWDSNYHPGDEGSAKRSAMLALEAAAQFTLEKEGSQ